MNNTRKPNQRKIKISKSAPQEGESFALIKNEDISNASYNLQSKAGFKLYIYLAKNVDKWEFNLSSKHFMMWAGVGTKAYTSAFEELVTFGYLEQIKGKPDDYILRAYRPQKEPEEITIHNTYIKQ